MGDRKEALSMPRYELMYLLGSDVADNEVPEAQTLVLKAIEDFGGTSVVENNLGKKKLAYPIKKTRNGYYVVVNFVMDTNKINGLAAKIKTMDGKIIRHLLVNLEEHLARAEKDKVQQDKLAKAQKARKLETEKTDRTAAPVLEIDQVELDKKIEEALSEDVTK